jgi:hypothetical protein
MQSKQSVVTAVVLAVGTILTATVGLTSERDVQRYSWSFPWQATVDRVLFVRAEAHDVGGVVLHTLRVSDATGRLLYEYEGNKLLSVVPLQVSPGDEDLLVSRWTAGNRTNGLLVLRGRGSKVSVVANRLVGSDGVSLVDVDGDGYQEVITFTQDKVPRLSMAEWPLILEAYRWTGLRLEPLGRVPETEADRTLERLFVRPKTKHAAP